MQFEDKLVSLNCLRKSLTNLKKQPLMKAKVDNLSELSSVLSKKEKTSCGILNFTKQFKFGRLLRPYSYLKQQGYSFMDILTKFILIRLGGLSIYAEMKTGSKTMDENTLYRIHIPNKRILLTFT